MDIKLYDIYYLGPQYKFTVQSFNQFIIHIMELKKRGKW